MISLPDDEVTIKLKDFKKYYIKTLKKVDELSFNKKIRKSNELELDIDKQISIGCQKLGLYHTPKPLILKDERIIIKNMKMLYYYRNRLDGFGIEKS
jgi:glycerol-3-phosphate O-acyltransferase